MARVMLDDILKGRRLGPDDGWFRVASSQTRYEWSSLATRYDQNSNEKIERAEFPGGDNDFQRLDRDKDSFVTWLLAEQRSDGQVTATVSQ